MITRRELLGSAALASLALSTKAWTASVSDPNQGAIFDEISSWVSDPAHQDFFKAPEDQGTTKGSLILAPGDDRVKWAANFLSNVPTGKPIDIAKYFIRKVPSSYIMEWPADTPQHRLPANPLIVAFFASTKTAPYKGDETAWCAAFVCWILQHCGKPSPKSAGSVSFRDFAALPKIDDPNAVSVGDLVCFQHAGGGDAGHITFFDGFANADKSKAWCVGGNQGDKISRKAFSLHTGSLRLHSFRRVS